MNKKHEYKPNNFELKDECNIGYCLESGCHSELNTTKNNVRNPIKHNKPSATEPETLFKSQLQKIHNPLCHEIYSQMPTFIAGVQLWKVHYSDIIKIIIKYCPCSLASPPKPHKVCSTEPIDDVAQTHISIDVVDFNQKPFLHVIDNCTKRSETEIPCVRRLQDQISTLRRIQFYKHGIPHTIRADQEYNKPEYV